MRIKKILVVDDRMDNRVNLELILFSQDFEVITAPSAALAMHCAVLEQPDLILVSTDMPGQDGRSICEQLAATEATREIPLILLDSDTAAADKIPAGHPLGVKVVISAPPYSDSDILDSIRRLEDSAAGSLDTGGRNPGGLPH